MKFRKDKIGNRMKENYEDRAKTKLTRRMPVIIRLDMKAGHTFTRGFYKPFDFAFSATMQQTMEYLCKNIQGCVFGYTQSDEITLVLVDYKKLNSEAWFDYQVQKMCSIAASMATLEFNRQFASVADKISHADGMTDEIRAAHIKSIEKGAIFDARCFNIPKEEVTNGMIWRQQDAVRNSIQAAGRAKFSAKELDHKNSAEIEAMLLSKYGINWTQHYTDYDKYGTCCRKGLYGWTIEPAPHFTTRREYIESVITFDDEGNLC